MKHVKSPIASLGLVSVAVAFLLDNALPQIVAAAAPQWIDQYEALTYEGPDGAKLPYRLLKPLDYDPAKRYPLVLCLHGLGGRSDDNVAQMTDTGQYAAPLLLTAESLRKKHPCFVLAPQCPPRVHDARQFANQWVAQPWNAATYRTDQTEISVPLRMVIELVEKLVKQYSIDPDRLYVTGLSMGGYGTWDILCRRPEMFAAAIPVCGGSDPSRAKDIAGVAVWAFHGAADSVIPVRGSREMIEALRAAGGNPKYTECEGVGHNVWVNAYTTEGLWDWLFSQKRTQPAQKGR